MNTPRRRPLLGLVSMGFGRDDLTDELMSVLAGEVAGLQRTAVDLQKAGMRYMEIVVPIRYAETVKDGMTLLGRRVVAADVERVSILVHPLP